MMLRSILAGLSFALLAPLAAANPDPLPDRFLCLDLERELPMFTVTKTDRVASVVPAGPSHGQAVYYATLKLDGLTLTEPATVSDRMISFYSQSHGIALVARPQQNVESEEHEEYNALIYRGKVHHVFCERDQVMQIPEN